jgi:hypothetical protein
MGAVLPQERLSPAGMFLAAIVGSVAAETAAVELIHVVVVVGILFCLGAALVATVVGLRLGHAPQAPGGRALRPITRSRGSPRCTRRGGDRGTAGSHGTRGRTPRKPRGPSPPEKRPGPFSCYTLRSCGGRYQTERQPAPPRSTPPCAQARPEITAGGPGGVRTSIDGDRGAGLGQRRRVRVLRVALVRPVPARSP